MLRLRPYHPNDAQHVVSWITDETAFYKWCANRFDKYPITAEELNDHYYSAGEDFFVMTAFDEDGPVGQLTMRYPEENRTHVRFGYIIVDDRRRGKGYGRQMLTLALEYAFRILGAGKVSLGVFENNPSAQRCYKASGLRETGGGWTCNIMGEEWKCIEMCVKKEDYYANI